MTHPTVTHTCSTYTNARRTQIITHPDTHQHRYRNVCWSGRWFAQKPLITITIVANKLAIRHVWHPPPFICTLPCIRAFYWHTNATNTSSRFNYGRVSFGRVQGAVVLVCVLLCCWLAKAEWKRRHSIRCIFHTIRSPTNAIIIGSQCERRQTPDGWPLYENSSGLIARIGCSCRTVVGPTVMAWQWNWHSHRATHSRHSVSLASASWLHRKNRPSFSSVLRLFSQAPVSIRRFFRVRV